MVLEINTKMENENIRVAPRLDLEFQGTAIAETHRRKLQLNVMTNNLTAYEAYLFSDTQPPQGNVEIRLG